MKCEKHKNFKGDLCPVCLMEQFQQAVHEWVANYPLGGGQDEKIAGYIYRLCINLEGGEWERLAELIEGNKEGAGVDGLNIDNLDTWISTCFWEDQCPR